MLAEGNTTAALQEAEIAVSYLPSWQSYLRRAEAYRAAREWQPAKADYERVLAMVPDDEAAKRGLSEVSRAEQGKATTTTREATTVKPLDLHTVDFTTVRYPLPDPDLIQDDVEVKDVAFGDLDGGGNDEAAVLLMWNYARLGGSGWGLLCYVYSGTTGKLTRLAQLEAGSKSADVMVKDLDISGGELIVTRCESEAGKKPSEYLATASYKWNGRQFVEVRKRRTPVTACWFQ